MIRRLPITRLTFTLALLAGGMAPASAQTTADGTANVRVEPMLQMAIENATVDFGVVGDPGYYNSPTITTVSIGNNVPYDL